MKTTLTFLFVLGLGFSAPLAFSQPASVTPTPPPEVTAPANASAETNAPVKVEESATPAASTNAPAATIVAAATDADVPTAVSAGDSTQTENAAAASGTGSSDNRGPLILEHELPAAIQFLSRMANLNIQFDPSLVFTNSIPGPDGKVAAAPMVSLRWDNITAEDALSEVLDNYGLMLVVNPKTSVGRVTRKPTQLPLVTTIFQLRYASPTNIVDVVKSTFADPARSKISADLRTSQLVIVTTEKEMFAVTNLITHLDSPTRQVLIEARLLETAKNPTSIKGIDWAGTLQNQNFSFGNGITSGNIITRSPGDGHTTTLPSGRTMESTSSKNIASSLVTAIGNGGISANTMSGFSPATAFLSADGVHAVLSFLNSENDTEVVATPRAVTADNQTAVLSVTRAFPIFQVTPGSANVASSAQVQYTNLGTILKVTPRIAANSNVALKVIPEVSNIDSKDKQIINGAVNEANVYAIRRMEADVMIPSGNTLVMGGLLSDSSTKSYSKVPLLGDLPGIGLAFRRDTKSRNKANLLIFVTPTIIEEADFRPTPTTFLQTPMPNKPDPDYGAWDSGKPYDWKKSDHK
jgi:type II secretory pathway component GspD/PulD (secretin)